MKKQKSIAIIGGDLRQTYLAHIMYAKKIPTVCYANTSIDGEASIAGSLKQIMDDSEVLICPIPFTTDNKYISSQGLKEDLTLSDFKDNLKPWHILIGGKFPTVLKEYCYNNKISHYDLLENEAFSIHNAISTAEGAIMEAMKHSPVNIHNSRCLVLGYGKCGSVLANRLSSLHGNITIFLRNENKAATANVYGYSYCYENGLAEKIKQSDFIFNTVPSVILTEDLLRLVSKHATIIDIASAPGGLDYEYVKSAGLNAHLCLGIPGKVSPLTSARIIYTKVEKILSERTNILLS